MSIEAMNHAYDVVVGSPTRKAVFVTLANISDNNGRSFPSIQYIADRTELSRRAVTRSLTQLAEDGFLEITERMGKTGQRSNLYVIDLSGGSDSHTPHDTQSQPHDRESKPHDTQSYITIINNHITNIRAKDEFADWMKVRKLKKAVWTERTAKSYHKKLFKFSADPETQRLIIAQSADNGWQDLFPLRNNYGSHQQNNRTSKQSVSDRIDQQVQDAIADAQQETPCADGSLVAGHG